MKDHSERRDDERGVDLTAEDRALARFHDGEATPAERGDVERLVETSDTARAELGWMAKLGRGLRHGVPTGSPAGLGERIMTRIRQMQAEQHPLVSLLPHMRRIAVAAAVLIAVGAVVIFAKRPGPATPNELRAEERLVSRPDPLKGTGTATRFYEPRLTALYRLNGPRGARGKDGSDR